MIRILGWCRLLTANSQRLIKEVLNKKEKLVLLCRRIKGNRGTKFKKSVQKLRKAIDS